MLKKNHLTHFSIFLLLDMQIQTSEIEDKSRYSIKGLLLNLGALLFLFLLFSFQVFNTSFHSLNTLNKGYNQGKSKFLYCSFEQNNHKKDCEYPINNDTNGTEPTEDNEFSDDDPNKYYPTVLFINFNYFSRIETIVQPKVSILSYNASFHKRKVIPLFILQQSWKAFIS